MKVRAGDADLRLGGWELFPMKSGNVQQEALLKAIQL